MEEWGSDVWTRRVCGLRQYSFFPSKTNVIGEGINKQVCGPGRSLSDGSLLGCYSNNTSKMGLLWSGASPRTACLMLLWFVYLAEIICSASQDYQMTF